MGLYQKVNILKPVSVKELRLLYGCTQLEFAKVLSLSRNAYRRRENNDSPFYASEIKRLSEFTGVPENMISA